MQERPYPDREVRMGAFSCALSPSDVQEGGTVGVAVSEGAAVGREGGAVAGPALLALVISHRPGASDHDRRRRCRQEWPGR